VTGIQTITVGGSASTGLAAGGSITPANISATATTLNIATTGLTATNDVLVGTGTVVGPAGAFTLGLGGSAAANTARLLGALTVTDTGAGIEDSITIRNNAATGTGTANFNVWNSQNIVSTGYETVTLTSGSTAGGVANAFGNVTVTGDIGGTTAETVNFSGANIVTVGVITADIVDASALTAAGTSTAPTITMTTASTATKVTGSAGIDVLFGSSSSSTVFGGAGNDTINGGAGNDSLLGEAGDDTLIGSTGNDSIDGGVGNDRVETGAGLLAGDTIVGGDGVDTLAITSDVTNDASGMSAVSGFEILEVASGQTDDITMSNFTNSQTFTRVDYSQMTGGTATVNNVPASVTDVRILAGAIGDTLVFDRLIDNSTNAVTISSRTGAATAVTLLTANDEETISFSGLTAADDLTLTNFNATDLTTLNITGDADFVVTVTNVISSTLLATLNASSSTGAVTVNNSNNAVKATVTGGSGILTYTGGAASDAITGGSLGDVLDGGAGSDTINGGSGSDVITGGIGADVINVGSGTDTIALGTSGATVT
jgi:Ca2+-binding RTX toxin-like protein